jgi:cytochrome b6-f complex iron-sulfur subunit
MSVAEMMAAARAEKDKKATAEKPAPKPSTAKSDAKQSPKAPVAAKATSQPMDTASILAAARKSTKAGPMSKAEAAKLHKDAPKKVSAPVMPEKPAYAVAKPATTDVTDRRNFFSVMFGSFLAVGFFCLGAVSTIWGLGLARFLFPNILTEPPSKFKVGFPSDFPPETVATKFKAQFGVWVVNTEYDGQQQITALKSVCTHLGCTPNWLDGEQKFKCPCHGSGFYIDGINFEGPAPRPLERYAIRIADDGQIEIDKSKKFQQEMGQWNSPACFVPV